jgi:hypothetical protein
VKPRGELVAGRNNHESEVHDREEALADIEAVFLSS